VRNLFDDENDPPVLGLRTKTSGFESDSNNFELKPSRIAEVKIGLRKTKLRMVSSFAIPPGTQDLYPGLITAGSDNILYSRFYKRGAEQRQSMVWEEI
jgi:hypothetical protein